MPTCNYIIKHGPFAGEPCEQPVANHVVPFPVSRKVPYAGETSKWMWVKADLTPRKYCYYHQKVEDGIITPLPVDKEFVEMEKCMKEFKSAVACGKL